LKAKKRRKKKQIDINHTKRALATPTSLLGRGTGIRGVTRMVRPAHAVAASLADNEMIMSPISALGLCDCDDEALTPCPMLFVFPSSSFLFFRFLLSLVDYASKQAQINAYIKCYTQLDESRLSRKLNATQTKFVPNHGFKPPTFGCTTHIAPMKHPVAKSCTDDVYISPSWIDILACCPGRCTNVSGTHSGLRKLLAICLSTAAHTLC
jgi:hypothetical protein